MQRNQALNNVTQNFSHPIKKITKHTRKQENMIYNLEKNQSTETDSEMTEIIE